MEMENIYSNISSIVPGSLRSLTSHLEERESPIRNFLYDRFPNTRPAFADARAKLTMIASRAPKRPVQSRRYGGGARQQVMLRWPLDRLLRTLAGDDVPPIKTLRAQFRRVVRRVRTTIDAALGAWEDGVHARRC